MDRFPHTPIPRRGLARADVLAKLLAMKQGDQDWRGGRVFSLVYSAGDEVHELLQDALSLYSAENGLNVLAFPSIGTMQHDIIRNTAAIAWYLLMDGPIGWASQAGSDRNIRQAYARAMGGPDPDNPGYIHPGFFPGIQRQNTHPDVTPSLTPGQDPGHDEPRVFSDPRRGWQQYRCGRPVVGGF